MATLSKSEFNQLIEDNIKTAAGQPKTTGPGIATVLRGVRDNLWGSPRIVGIITDDPSGDENPVTWKLGDVFDPEFNVNLSNDEALQVSVDGDIYYIPVINVTQSITPGEEYIGVRTITGDDSLNVDDELLLVDASLGDVEVELLPPSNTRSAFQTVKKIDDTTNKVTFSHPEGGQIEFGLDIDMTKQGETRVFRHDKTDYYLQ